MYKTCIICKKEYKKSVYVCSKQWIKSKFCSNKCHGIYKNKIGIIPPSRKGMKNWCYGKENPYMTGANNPNWKGGVSKKNKTERQLAMEKIEYKLWRRSVFERDNFTCQFCGERGSRLNADHIKPWILFPELRYAIDNGRTLCEECHRGTKTYRLNQFNQKEILSMFLN